MIRFLPIILLAIGLVFAFSSLTRAETAAPAAQAPGVVCLEETEAELTLPEPKRNSVLCWKRIKTGLIITPCTPDPSMIAMPIGIAPPDPGYPCPLGSSLTASEIEPIQLLRPPRA